MDLSQGQLVRSIAGRDKGKFYLVIGFAQEKMLVADGQYRTLKDPKTKNIKHLQSYKHISDRVVSASASNQLTDTLLRQELQSILQEESARGKEVC